jgi:hypothetical protein
MTNVPIRHFTEQPATAEGCTATSPPFPEGFFSGAIALIHRGSCAFTEKIQNAFNAGATAVIIRNNQAGALSMATPGQPNIPAYSIDQTPGNALVAFVDANPTTATVTLQINPIPADVLAGFSMRGPTRAPWQDLQKPDITAPGVNIYAAYTGAAGYSSLSGTSMSAPHTAGAMALVRSIRPAWTPAEVKSAVMMTAKKEGTKEDRVTPWDPDDVGSGRVDLTKAARAGLVMNETTSNFLNADPATGGDVKTLNLPAMRNMQCAPHCTWTRTVRNTRTTPTSWNASAMAITPGFNLTVSPANFSFTGNLGETQELTITAVPTSVLTGPVAFGEVVLSQSAPTGVGEPTAPDARMTVAIKGEPFVVSAVSRKLHGANNHDIALPLLGPVGIESRTGPVDGAHQLVVTFTAPVTLTGASVVEGTGTATFVPAGSTVTVNLAGVTDVQRLRVRLTNVSNGPTTVNMDIPMGVLAGDVNANGIVNAADVGQTKAATSPGTVDGSNFRMDINANGSINAADVAIAKSRSGNALP